MSEQRKSNEVFSQNSALPPGLQQHMDAVKALSGDQSESVQQVQPQRTQQSVIREESIDDMLFKEFGIAIPAECVPLPSKGLVYPIAHPLHKKDLVDIKAMSTKEEDILTSPALFKKGTVITELIRSCLIDKSVNPLDLLSGDRNAIMVGIRVTGYGPRYEGEIVCSQCGEKSTREFNLADLEVKPLTILPVEQGINEFEWIGKHGKQDVSVRFKFLTGRDEEEISRTAERQKKQLGTTYDQTVTQTLQHCILSVNGKSDKAKLMQLITRLPAEFSSNLRKFIKENEPGLKMSQLSLCPHCNHEEEVSIPIGVKFFWPNAE